MQTAFTDRDLLNDERGVKMIRLVKKLKDVRSDIDSCEDPELISALLHAKEELKRNITLLLNSNEFDEKSSSESENSLSDADSVDCEDPYRKFGVYLSGNLPKHEKELVLCRLLSKMVEKEKQIQAMATLMREKRQSNEKEVHALSTRMEGIVDQKEGETVEKPPIQREFTVKGVIDMFETNFSQQLADKDVSRAEKWKEYFETMPEGLKRFHEAGFSAEQVIAHVEALLKSHSDESIQVTELKASC